MTTEERFQLHEQMIASIERNLGALVEAQQKNERQIERVHRRAETLERFLDSLLGRNEH